MSKKPNSINFETAVAELEATIIRMEKGEMSLEEALQSFEEGVRLSRECQKLLASAEQRITLLTDDGEEDFLANE
ncbi:MAG: exodeoxyribonuclease VII small subunit [Leucothrix sp.]